MSGRPMRTALPTLLLLAAAVASSEEYRHGPDSERHDGVPKGKVTQLHWASAIFAGTERDWWIYVPAQYDQTRPSAYMVFQDGGWYLDEHGDFRVPVVLDNLIARGELPPIIGIFINPGVFPGKNGEKDRSDRSFEYDTLSDQYVRFLAEEILPQVAKSYALSADAKDHAIGGASSGAICAFTAAWQRPALFSKVLSHIGSYTDIAGGRTLIEGGHNYPPLIRRTKPAKPIRVFLQDGTGDIDNEFGNWHLANLEMAAALKFAGYDHTTEWGTEGHNGKHGGAILPDSLRWLWRGAGLAPAPEKVAK